MTDRNNGWGVVLGPLVPDLRYASFEADDDSGEATVYVFDRNGSRALDEYPQGWPI